MEIECPYCHAVRLDDETLICGACGMAALQVTDDEPPTEALLPGFLRNVRLLLFDLKGDEYQQLRGILGPAAGETEGTPFDDQSSRLAQAYLTKNGIPTLRVIATANGRTEISLVIAATAKGLKRATREARVTARRLRASLKVLGPND